MKKYFSVSFVLMGLIVSFFGAKAAEYDYVCWSSQTTCDGVCDLYGEWNKITHQQGCVYAAGYRTGVWGNTVQNCPVGTETDTANLISEIFGSQTWGSDYSQNLVDTSSCDIAALRRTDTTPPTCDTGVSPTSSGWTCPSVNLSVSNCQDDNSGCDPASYTAKSFGVNGANLKNQGIQACDHAGNCTVCTEPTIETAKIDCEAPILTKQTQLQHSGLLLEKENISEVLASPTPFRANAGNLQLLISVKDTAANSVSGESGISWGTPSFIEIERIGSTKTQKFDLSNATSTGNENEYTLDINQYRYTDEAYPIFSQTGTYKITMSLHDNTENRCEDGHARFGCAKFDVDRYEPYDVTTLSNAKIQTFYIRIYPASASQEKTMATLNSNCGTANLYADNHDLCDITFTLKDPWENIIRENSSIEMFLPDQDVNGSYDVLQEQGENYQNGIRFINGTDISLSNGKTVNKIVWNTPQNGEKHLQIKSILPSVSVLSNGMDGIMTTVNKVLPFELVTPLIGPRGDFNGTPEPPPTPITCAADGVSRFDCAKFDASSNYESP